MKTALFSTELNKLLRSIESYSRGFYFKAESEFAALPVQEYNHDSTDNRIMQVYLMCPGSTLFDRHFYGGLNLYSLELDVRSIELTASSPLYCEIEVTFSSRIGDIVGIVSLERKNTNRRWALPKHWDMHLEMDASFNLTQALDS